MKNFILLYLFCLSSFTILAQCPTQELRYTRQSQIDSFPILYPNCTEIDQDVNILPSDINNLKGFSKITAFNKYLVINGTKIQDLSGLDSLKIVGSQFDINSNANLTSLKNLKSLISVDSSFFLTHNNNLKTLEGLNNLKSINGIFDISNNSNLETLEGLNSLTTISSNLELGFNNFKTLKGLEKIKKISGYLTIYNCHFLETLKGLDNLDTTGGVWLTMNKSLHDLKAISNTNFLDFAPFLSLQNNTMLSNCSINSFCTYFKKGNRASIQLNSAGCNSVSEILSACITPTFELNKSNFEVYPNPAFDKITISNFSKLRGTIKIYDVFGKMTISQPLNSPQNEVFIAHLSKGFYIVKINSHEKTWHFKILKN